MLNFRELALSHSMNCFFNSYIRDMNPAYNKAESSFDIEVAGEFLKLRVKHFSLVGVHEFHEKLNYKGMEIDFLAAAELISQGTKLYSRVLNSIHNMELALANNESKITDLYMGKINFLSAEQGLHIGHSFHPSPKSRDEFSDEDLTNFAPEFGAKFKICWFFVRQDLVYVEKSETFKHKSWKKDFYKKPVPMGYVPYPVHPWQKHILLQDAVIKTYIQGKFIMDAGESEEDWYATSSMRSLYSPEMPLMMKFSMSVRMTNSIRHLQEKEVGRGMQIHDAFFTTSGKAFSQKYPQFKVMHEPAYAGIKDFSGKILPQTIVLLRENIIPQDEETAVLATLTQSHPLKGRNLIATCLMKGHSGSTWFKAILDHAFIPLLVAQADHGIMLGAHMQNLLIKLKDGLPVGSYFRDCQGTGFSELGLSLMSGEIRQKEKFQSHLVPREAALSLFTYYLVINSVLNTIAAVSRASGETEKHLIEILQERLLSLRTKVNDPFVINFLLSSPELNQKGNFRCSLEGLNENTTTNPLSIYNNFKNPLCLESSL